MQLRRYFFAADQFGFQIVVFVRQIRTYKPPTCNNQISSGKIQLVFNII